MLKETFTAEPIGREAEGKGVVDDNRV